MQFNFVHESFSRLKGVAVAGIVVYFDVGVAVGASIIVRATTKLQLKAQSTHPLLLSPVTYISTHTHTHTNAYTCSILTSYLRVCVSGMSLA